MWPFGMDPTRNFGETFDGFKCESVDENVCHTVEDKMTDMKHFHFLMESKHDNIAVDNFLGVGIENMMEEVSHGFDFSFLPDYGGLDSCSTLDGEAGLELEILDGFLDEVEDIYASQDLSSIGDRIIPKTELTEKVSESDSYYPGIRRSCRLSELSKESLPHNESENVSSDKVLYQEPVKDTLDTTSNEMHSLYESEDDKKPLSTFITSWIEQGKGPKKNLLNTTCSRLDSLGGTKSGISYDFRPRKGPLKKCRHTTTDNTLSDDQLTTSEGENDISVTNQSKSRSNRRKNQRMWTVDEVVKLVDGISHFGVGKWTDIKNLFFESSSYRTPIDIRDKWRNLLKASYADGEAEEKRRSGSRPIPEEILDRVRELACLNPYPFSKSLYDSSTSRNSTSRKKKKKKRS